MKIIGIIGRAFYNKDCQKIFQIREEIRNYFSSNDVITIALLPPKDIDYFKITPGNDDMNTQDLEKLNQTLALCDGFVFPGGTTWYQFDEYIIKYAIENDKPLLAICLGFQTLCSMYAKKKNKI